MEINDAYLTLLTPDGEFLRARKQNQHYAIGEEILFFPSAKQERIKSLGFLTRIFSAKPVAAAAIALILLFGSYLSFYQNNKAYAYMSIDVNPSIELLLNKKMQVLKVTAFNQDGKKIVAHLGEWKNKDIAVITQQLIKEMKKQGYLKNHHRVVISTVRTEKTEQSAETVLTENIKEIKAEVADDDLQLTVVNGTPEDLKKAHDLGMTTGKYKELKQQSNQKKQPKAIEKPVKPNSDGNAPSTAPVVPMPPAPPAPPPPTKQPEVNQGSSAPPPVRSEQGRSQGNSGGKNLKPEKQIPPGQEKKIEETKGKWEDLKNEVKRESNIENHQQSENSTDEQKKNDQENKEQNSVQLNLPVKIQIQVNGWKFSN